MKYKTQVQNKKLVYRFNKMTSYCIIKILYVRYVNDDDDELEENIEINRERHYFDEIDTDRDTEDEESKINYIKYLKVNYKPRVLFSNQKWKNKKTKEKYEDCVLEEINNGIILSVIKKEIRYLC